MRRLLLLLLLPAAVFAQSFPVRVRLEVDTIKTLTQPSILNILDSMRVAGTFTTTGAATIGGALEGDGPVDLDSVWNTTTSSNRANVYIGSDGKLKRTTDTSASAPGSGITTLNGLITDPQTFAVDSAKGTWATTSSGSTHTFGYPGGRLPYLDKSNTFARDVTVSGAIVGDTVTLGSGAGAGHLMVQDDGPYAILHASPDSVEVRTAASDQSAFSVNRTDGAVRLQQVVGMTKGSDNANVYIDGSGKLWRTTDTSSAGGGITSLNGLSGATQTFAIDSTTNTWGISSASTTHTFGYPGTRVGMIDQAKTWTAVQTFKAGTGAIVATPASGTALFQETSGTGGFISFGNNTAAIGVSKDGVVAGHDYDGAMIFRQKGTTPDAPVEFIFLEESGAWRFALPKSGAGYGTYNPRSMIIAGPSTNDTNSIRGSYWGFTNLSMNTSSFGADLGVQNDIQNLGDSFLGNGSDDSTVVQQLVVNGQMSADTLNGSIRLTGPLAVNGTITGDTLTLGSGSGSGKLLLQDDGPYPILNANPDSVEIRTAASSLSAFSVNRSDGAVRLEQVVGMTKGSDNANVYIDGNGKLWRTTDTTGGSGWNPDTNRVAFRDKANTFAQTLTTGGSANAVVGGQVRVDTLQNPLGALVMPDSLSITGTINGTIPWTTIYRSADTTHAIAAFANLGQLEFNMDASGFYEIEAKLFIVRGTAATAWTIAHNFSQAPSNTAITATGYAAVATGTDMLTTNHLDTNVDSLQTTATTVTTGETCTMTGWILNTGSTTSYRLRWHTEVAGNITIKRGSYVAYRKLY